MKVKRRLRSNRSIPCLHGKARCDCKKCGGVSVCMHGRQRAYCKDCDGSAICVHKRQRNICKECVGGHICEHNNRRSRCRLCNPLGAFKIYVRNARKRKIEFLLTFEDYERIINQPCSYCGDSSESNGVDRQDNEAGYSLSNCVPCCTKCNYMKFRYSEQEFIAQAKKITKHQESKTWLTSM